MSFYLFLCRYSMLSQPQVNIFWTQELSKMIYTCDVNVQKQGHLNWIQGFQFSVAKATLQSQMSVRPSVCPSVCKTPQQLEIIILHHPLSFFIHPISFFIHPSFISRLLSFSACLNKQCPSTQNFAKSNPKFFKKQKVLRKIFYTEKHPSQSQKLNTGLKPHFFGDIL